MDANVAKIEARFLKYVTQYEYRIEINQFRLAYVQLILLFKRKLNDVQLRGTLNLQLQLQGKLYSDEDFTMLRNSCRHMLDSHLRQNTNATKPAVLNQLLFGALLESGEDDFHYAAEPMFHFARVMGVSPTQLKRILKAEFGGFTG